MKKRMIKTKADSTIEIVDCQDFNFYGFLKRDQPYFLLDLTESDGKIRVIKWNFQEITEYMASEKKSWINLLDEISEDFDECWVFDGSEELFEWLVEKIG